MTIQENVKKMTIEAMKAKDVIRRDNLKYLTSLFQKESKNVDKTIDDDKAIAIIKSQLKGSTETAKMCENDIRYKDEYIKTVNFIGICEDLIPKQATEEEVKAFIDTIDFTKLKNKGQAIGLTVKHFGGNVDGNLVKSLIMK